MNSSHKADWGSPVAHSDLLCSEHWILALLGDYGSFQPLEQPSWALSFLDVQTEEGKVVLGRVP